MKKIIFLFLLVVCSCTSVKITFDDSKVGMPEHVKRMLLEKFKGVESDKSVVVFTAWFEEDTVKIINDNICIFEKIVKTKSETGLGDFKIVSNETPVEVQIYSNKLVKIPLKRDYLKHYKFVYISRDVGKRNNYKLEYSNNWKGFM
jgi:hypothetical protein